MIRFFPIFSSLDDMMKPEKYKHVTVYIEMLIYTYIHEYMFYLLGLLSSKFMEKG